MIGKIRLRRPSPGTVLGGLALIVAMSGVAVAAIPNSDGSINGCVTKRTGALRVIDAASATCDASKEIAISFASTNATGAVANADRLDGKNSSDFLGVYETAFNSDYATNANLLDGHDSSSFLRGAVTVEGPNAAAGPIRHAVSRAECPAGTIVTGGGFERITGSDFDFYVQDSMPDGNGWKAQVYNRAARTAGANIVMRAYALCAD